MPASVAVARLQRPVPGVTSDVNRDDVVTSSFGERLVPRTRHATMVTKSAPHRRLDRQPIEVLRGY